MTTPTTLRSLSPREAVADALHRCVLGIDSNNHALFASACLQNSTMTVTAGPVILQGWEAINDYFQRVFALVTTHIISNIRVELKDAADVDGGDVNTANMTAHAISYHVREEDRFKVEDTSYTAASLYTMQIVRDGEDGLWKIKSWDLNVLWTTGDKAVLYG